MNRDPIKKLKSYDARTIEIAQGKINELNPHEDKDVAFFERRVSHSRQIEPIDIKAEVKKGKCVIL